MMTERRQEKFDAVARRRQPDLTVVVENIHDPHNVSAILRTCDAAGVLGVQLIYTDEEFPDIGKKSSASAKKWIQRRHFPTIETCYSTLRKEGYTIWATRIGNGSKSLYDLDLSGKCAIVVGNEHRGVSDDAARLADGTFEIPMFGMIQSLNVSVACAISLFEAVRQRLKKNMYDQSRLPTDALEELIADWMRK